MNERQAIHVTLGLQPTTTSVFLSRAGHFTDELMEIETRDGEISDSTVGADAGTGQITIEMLVFTNDPLHAIVTALTAIRTAIHAAGDGTPGWPDAAAVSNAIDMASARTERTLVPA